MKYKDYYNDEYILDISQKILAVMPDFDEKSFFMAGFLTVG